jgi:LysR family hydrogen peroxide-inducible transcriptional activator
LDGIRLLPFHAPEPRWAIGLAWRKTSPRKRDFIELAKLLRQAAPRPKSTHARDAQ